LGIVAWSRGGDGLEGYGIVVPGCFECIWVVRGLRRDCSGV